MNYNESIALKIVHWTVVACTCALSAVFLSSTYPSILFLFIFIRFMARLQKNHEL